MMNRALYFLIGVGCGAGITYFFLKDKYERYAQEEIDSVKEEYKVKKVEEEACSEPEQPEEEVQVKNEKPDLKDLKEYAKKVKQYKDYSTKVERPADPAHKPFSEEPYLISQEEYDDDDSVYDKEPVIFYADEVLAYETDDEVFDDADEKLVPDFEAHFGDDDAVYVRNEITKTDYAIYKDNRTYEEVTGKKPHRIESEE